MVWEVSKELCGAQMPDGLSHNTLHLPLLKCSFLHTRQVMQFFKIILNSNPVLLYLQCL